VIAEFDSDLPSEAIAYLGASSEPLRVRLLWRPSLLQQPGFQVCLALLALGVILMVVGSWRLPSFRTRPRATPESRRPGREARVGSVGAARFEHAYVPSPSERSHVQAPS
jgi:hypothetical protein